MSEETQEEQTDEKRKRTVSEGLKQGLGALSAVKDAIEETITEARERGDLNTDRAKSTVRKALDRAQSAAEEAKERFDFPQQKDFDVLVARVAAIERHLGIQFAPVTRVEGEDDGGDLAEREDPEGGERDTP